MSESYFFVAPDRWGRYCQFHRFITCHEILSWKWDRQLFAAILQHSI